MRARINSHIKHLLFGITGLCLIIAWLYAASDQKPRQASASLPSEHASISSLPVSFEPNTGQTNIEADFLSRNPGYTLLLNAATAVFNLAPSKHLDKTKTAQPSSLNMHFINANNKAVGVGGRQTGQSHYYHGSNPSDWHTNIPLYKKVTYRQIYPGTDVVYYGNQGQIEFDFMLAPGADPQQIRIAFDDTAEMHINASGDLTFNQQDGLIIKKPVAYQYVEGHKKIIDAAFDLSNNNQVSFTLAAYNSDLPLIIDPVITYGSYIGGDGADEGLAIAVDSDGNRYLTGSSSSVDFPGANVKAAGLDVFVAKLDASGTNLVYATYLGGNGDDIAHDIVVDANGNAYLTGDTSSGSLPNSGGFQTVPGGPPGDQDGFIAKLNSSGIIEYTTYLGGSNIEISFAIAIDTDDPPNLFVGGSTLSDDFPMTAGCAFPIQCTHSSSALDQADGFVSKISNDGSTLLYSTFIGGSNADKVADIAINSSGQAYLTGDTSSPDFPVTLDAFQTNYGGQAADAHVVILASNGTRIYSTFLGGGSWDRGLGIATDATGIAYVTGFTSSALIITGNGENEPGFPVTEDAYQITNGGGDFDAFFSKIDPLQGGLDGLLYSTYLGGNGRDEAVAIALNTSGQAFIVGTTRLNPQPIVGLPTNINNFPLENPLQFEGLGDSDGFIAQFDADASLLFSSYLGGNSDDTIAKVVIDNTGATHLIGTSTSENLALAGSFRDEKASAEDVFVTTIDTTQTNLPDLAVSITTDPFPVPQDNVQVFFLDVANNGPSAIATGVGITFRVDNSTITTAIPTQGACTILDTITMSCDIGALGPGASTSITVSTDPTNIGDATSTVALLRANQSDTNAGNNTASIQTLIVDNSGSSSAGSTSFALLLLTLAGLARRRFF